MTKNTLLFSISCFFALASLVLVSAFVDPEPTETTHFSNKPKSEVFLNLLTAEEDTDFNRIFNEITQNWMPSDEAFLLETLYFTQSKSRSKTLLKLLKTKTSQDFGDDLDLWYQWLWNKKETYSDAYFAFKAELHQLIDPKFYTYFKNRSSQSLIRLDEVRWGGVRQDGIPPLRKPKMTTALEATYLRDGATVFGIEVNGDARAYPKQILAWHEMFVDKVGGTDVAGVYCTLCGTVILYKTEHNGTVHEMGTSGFLYRSNKLMYDKATQSLWSTLEGTPVIGPLVNKDIRLEYLSVVTTTWGEWKKRHPDTKVLSLDTGHRRDYREGVAYKDYFSTDELMFTVPNIDRSLKNKDEILAIRLPGKTSDNLAIDSQFLKKNTVYANTIASVNFTVFTDTSGAHRVFKTKDIHFTNYDGKVTIIDDTGTKWEIQENILISDEGVRLERLPSHNAFWFGYKAAFPDVELIK